MQNPQPTYQTNQGQLKWSFTAFISGIVCITRHSDNIGFIESLIIFNPDCRHCQCRLKCESKEAFTTPTQAKIHKNLLKASQNIYISCDLFKNFCLNVADKLTKDKPIVSYGFILLLRICQDQSSFYYLLIFGLLHVAEQKTYLNNRGQGVSKLKRNFWQLFVF